MATIISIFYFKIKHGNEVGLQVRYNLSFRLSPKCQSLLWLKLTLTLILLIKCCLINVLSATLFKVLQRHSVLLFISYKFVKGFLAITFLFLVFSSWNFHDVCQRLEQIFSSIRQKTNISPIYPHYKNRLHL